MAPRRSHGNTKLQPAHIAFVRDLRARGTPWHAVRQAVLDSYGFSVSVETLRNTLTRGAPPLAAQTQNDVGTPVAAEETATEVPSLEEVLRELWQCLRDARAYARLPEVKQNGTRYLAALSRVSDLGARLSRFLPKPTEDPNDAPDVIAAADRCRTKLHETLERLVNP